MVLLNRTRDLDAINYNQALKIKPNFAEAFNSMGNAQKDKGELDAAIKSYKQALKIKPNFAEALNNMAMLNRIRRIGCSNESHKQALKIKPNFAEAYNSMGNA